MPIHLFTFHRNAYFWFRTSWRNMRRRILTYLRGSIKWLSSDIPLRVCTGEIVDRSRAPLISFQTLASVFYCHVSCRRVSRSLRGSTRESHPFANLMSDNEIKNSSLRFSIWSHIEWLRESILFTWITKEWKKGVVSFFRLLMQPTIFDVFMTLLLDSPFRQLPIALPVPYVWFAYIHSFAHEHSHMSAFALLFENNQALLLSITSKHNS